YRKLHKNQSPRSSDKHPNERHQSALLAKSEMIFVEQDAATPLIASFRKPDRVVRDAKRPIGKSIAIRYVDNSPAAQRFDYGGIDRAVHTGRLRRNTMAL